MEIAQVGHNLPVNPVTRIKKTGDYLQEEHQAQTRTQMKSTYVEDGKESDKIAREKSHEQLRAEQIRENLKNYREAGLINHEEMKALLAIMIPAGSIPDEELAREQEKKDHLIEEMA